MFLKMEREGRVCNKSRQSELATLINVTGLQAGLNFPELLIVPFFSWHFNSARHPSEGNHSKPSTNILKNDWNPMFSCYHQKAEDHCPLWPYIYTFPSIPIYFLCIWLPGIFSAPSGYFHLIPNTPSPLLFSFLHLSSQVLLLPFCTASPYNNQCCSGKTCCVLLLDSVC